jgi:hypothetical protein
VGFSRETDEGTDQNSFVTEPSSAPRRGITGRPMRILLYIVLGIIGVVVVFGMLGGGGDSLKVEWKEILRGTKVVSVTNIGDKPITITNVVVNDRKDCKVQRATHIDQDNPSSLVSKLDIGDYDWFVSITCIPIRTTITTTDGSYTYSFN